MKFVVSYFVRLIFSGSKFYFPIISDTHPFSIVFIIIVAKASCTSLDISMLYTSVTLGGGPIRMMNIQEVDKKSCVGRNECNSALQYIQLITWHYYKNY